MQTKERNAVYVEGRLDQKGKKRRRGKQSADREKKLKDGRFAEDRERIPAKEDQERVEE